MKYTLLDIVQDILSSMDSDEVNSIGDTTESMQVARLVRTVYTNMLARANLPEHQKIFSLDASTDTDIPVIMLRPDNVTRIDWIKYNMEDEGGEPMFRYITIVPMEQFMDLTNLNPDETGVEAYTLGDLNYMYRTDRMPTFCTIFNDYMILFDAFDSNVDSTLQESKTMCFGLVSPQFLLEDTYIPEMDEGMFPLLINEAKALAFMELKQMTHELAVQESKRQWRTMQRNKYVTPRPGLSDMPDFGRRGSRAGRTYVKFR